MAPESDRNLRLSESDHRIANNLTIIAGVIRLRASALASTAPVTGDDAATLLTEAAQQIEAVARLHRLLMDKPNNKLVNIGAYLREICDTIAATFGCQVHIAQSYPAESLMASEQALPVALIVSEAVTNSCKYAHPTGIHGRVELTCTVSPAGAFEVSVHDDGVGLPETFDPAHDGGLGLKVIRALAGQLGAEWSLTSQSIGTRFRLKLPANASR